MLSHLVHLGNNALRIVLESLVDSWDEFERVQKTTSFGGRFLDVISKLVGPCSGNGRSLSLFEWQLLEHLGKDDRKPFFGEDTASDEVPDPSDSFGVLGSLDFHRDGQYLGEGSSVREIDRLRNSETGEIS